MKKIIGFLLCLMLGVCLAGGFETSVQAKDSVSEVNNFHNYLEKFYTETQLRKVEDVNGNDVTNEFIARTQNIFDKGDEGSIKKIMQEEELVLHIFSLESASGNISTFGLDRYKNVASDLISFYLTSDNGVRLFVVSELKGGIWYDEASGKVKRTTNATYNIIGMETGTKYSVTANDFATGSSVSNGKGYFWGRCSFIGQMTDDYGTHYYANFGSKQVSFYATP